MGITIYFGIGLILILIASTATAIIIKKNFPNASNSACKTQKMIIYIIATLQFVLLLLYFTSALAFINPPDFLLFPVWFLIAIGGLGASIFLFVKRELLPLAIVMLLSSILLFGIGALMRLFLTM